MKKLYGVVIVKKIFILQKGGERIMEQVYIKGRDILIMKKILL